MPKCMAIDFDRSKAVTSQSGPLQATMRYLSCERLQTRGMPVMATICRAIKGWARAGYEIISNMSSCDIRSLSRRRAAGLPSQESEIKSVAFRSLLCCSSILLLLETCTLATLVRLQKKHMKCTQCMPLYHVFICSPVHMEMIEAA